LEREFAKTLGEMRFPTEILQWLVAELRESEKTAQAEHAEALRRHQVELDRLQRRQEVMYDDRLDGRIDAVTFDNRIAQIQVQREQIRQRALAAEAAMPAPANQVVDLKQLTSQIGQRFSKQAAAEQRKLLQVVVQQASWKNGELRVTLREPFESLRLTHRNPVSEHHRRVDQ
jgi:excinuclease UvrABC nuclease subunit